MSVKVEHITKLYEDQRALDDVSFEVKAGEIVGLLGPNGAGKSTLMKIISCYIPCNSGNALVCGYDITNNSLDVRKNVGYLPEHTPLYLDMYVREYLSFIGGIYGINNIDSRVKEMIAMTGLEVEQKKKIGALSKGYRQRVGIAQALIHDPKVLILDEPTSGLDPNQLHEIRNLIKNIGKEKTVILSTHIMQEVTAICNRVLIINKGKIVADDTADNLQNKLTEENTVNIEFDKETTKEKLQHVTGVLHVENIQDFKWKITSAIDQDIRSNLFQFAVQNNLIVLAMQKKEQSLEDIFHQLTLSK